MLNVQLSTSYTTLPLMVLQNGTIFPIEILNYTSHSSALVSASSPQWDWWNGTYAARIRRQACIAQSKSRWTAVVSGVLGLKWAWMHCRAVDGWLQATIFASGVVTEFKPMLRSVKWNWGIIFELEQYRTTFSLGYIHRNRSNH